MKVPKSLLDKKIDLSLHPNDPESQTEVIETVEN